MRGDGVAGEGRVVGIPKFYSWGKCTMPTLPLACVLYCYVILGYIIYLRGSFKLHLGV